MHGPTMDQPLFPSVFLNFFFHFLSLSLFNLLSVSLLYLVFYHFPFWFLSFSSFVFSQLSLFGFVCSPFVFLNFLLFGFSVFLNFPYLVFCLFFCFSKLSLFGFLCSSFVFLNFPYLVLYALFSFLSTSRIWFFISSFVFLNFPYLVFSLLLFFSTFRIWFFMLSFCSFIWVCVSPLLFIIITNYNKIKQNKNNNPQIWPSCAPWATFRPVLVFLRPGAHPPRTKSKLNESFCVPGFYTLP